MAAQERADRQLTSDITEEHLVCSICSERFTDPRQLLCGHTFCYRCIDRHITTWLNPCCPLCNAVIISQTRDTRKEDWACSLPQSALIADIAKALDYHDPYSGNGAELGARNIGSHRGTPDDSPDPEVRLTHLCEFASEIVASENISPRKHKSNGMLMCRTAKLFHEQGDIEKAFVMYIRVLALFIEKLPKHSQYFTLIPSEITDIKQKVVEVLRVAERLKSRLRNTYQTEILRKEKREERLRTGCRGKTVCLRRPHGTSAPLTPTAPPVIAFSTPTKSTTHVGSHSPANPSQQKTVRFVDDKSVSPTTAHGRIKSKPPSRPPPPRLSVD